MSVYFKDVEDNTFVTVAHYNELKSDDVYYNEISIKLNDESIYLDIDTAVKFRKALTLEIAKAKNQGGNQNGAR